MELSISVFFQQFFPAKMTTRRWQQLERVELLCREKRVELAVRHGQNANNTLLASGMTRSAVGSSLEIRYFFGQQARLFYEWIARQRMRDCAMLLHSIAITNRYKGFVTMYFRSLWTKSSSFDDSLSVREFVCIFENEFRFVICWSVFNTRHMKI